MIRSRVIPRGGLVGAVIRGGAARVAGRREQARPILAVRVCGLASLLEARLIWATTHVEAVSIQGDRERQLRVRDERKLATRDDAPRVVGVEALVRRFFDAEDDHDGELLARSGPLIRDDDEGSDRVLDMRTLKARLALSRRLSDGRLRLVVQVAAVAADDDLDARRGPGIAETQDRVAADVGRDVQRDLGRIAARPHRRERTGSANRCDSPRAQKAATRSHAPSISRRSSSGRRNYATTHAPIALRSRPIEVQRGTLPVIVAIMTVVDRASTSSEPQQGV